MNYLLLMYPTPETFHASAASHQQCIDECRTLVDRLEAKGQYLGAGILEPQTFARNVRVRDGRKLVTDGPFIETREQFAGFLLIEAESLEEAIEIAMEHPVAHTGTVDVRPIKDVQFLSQPEDALQSAMN